MQPICIGCNKRPDELEEYIECASACGMTPDEFVKEEEGAYNPENGHFACTDCYIDMGMPALPAPDRWVAP
jgi:hypothetical protein